MLTDEEYFQVLDRMISPDGVGGHKIGRDESGVIVSAVFAVKGRLAPEFSEMVQKWLESKGLRKRIHDR